MGKKNSKRTAITPTREENFATWFQEVVKESEISEMAHVRGCMVIKPWGYGIWENIQQTLGNFIKETGVDNVYFPLFIPLSYIQKEADHVDGFAKEMAVVTHTRLEKDEATGELVPANKLTEPIVVRPTSETIIGESMSQWIKSYRDLPIKLNQWCNVVRWEMRPRILLRTVEFLWQEGHTAFATAKEAEDDSKLMLDVYTNFVENYLAMPLIRGVKPDYDKFPGAVRTYCIEALMQDGKALQAGTTHYLGDHFAKSADIKFSDKDNNIAYAHTASWGVSTRLIGGLVMTHADDDGMRVPPNIAPQQIILYPFLKNGQDEQNEKVIIFSQDIVNRLNKSKLSNGDSVRTRFDKREFSPSDKKWQWVKKGAPILVEIGMRDMENNMVTFRLRNEPANEKHQMTVDEFVENAPKLLEDMQKSYFEEAKERLNNGMKTVETFEEIKEYFTKEENPSFVIAPYKDSSESNSKLDDLQLTIRCIPLDQDDVEKTCVLSGEKTNTVAVFARSY